MRGGLDDALDKLARRDELRRRASGEAPSTTPPAVNELVEAIATVVARHPELGVSVGVEGAGDPLLLHFFIADGQVQVNAENAGALTPDAESPRHADFDLEADEAAERPYSAVPAEHTYSPGPAERPYSAAPYPSAPDEPGGGETRRLSHDDQDRFGPATFGYPSSAAPDEHYYAESDTAERRYGSFDSAPEPASAADSRYPARDPGESSRDLGARLRDLGMASAGQPTTPAYPPHPFAATPPPPVPPQTGQPAATMPSQPRQSAPPQPRPSAPPQADSAGPTRRIQPEQHRVPAEQSAAERAAPPNRHVPEQRGMPTPLPKPIPLQVERPEETEMAARRLAALLRDDPSLLDQNPQI